MHAHHDCDRLPRLIPVRPHRGEVPRRCSAAERTALLPQTSTAIHRHHEGVLLQPPPRVAVAGEEVGAGGAGGGRRGGGGRGAGGGTGTPQASPAPQTTPYTPPPLLQLPQRQRGLSSLLRASGTVVMAAAANATAQLVAL